MKINGKKVVDARKPLLLEITDQDVARGDKKEATSCAAAVACKRQLGAKSARVHLSRTYVEYDDRWVRYSTPSSIRTEIVSFDRGKKFEAGEYKLPILQPSKHAKGIRQGTHSNSKKLKGNTNGRGAHHHVSGVRASAISNVWHK